MSAGSSGVPDNWRKAGVACVFIWFAIGGVGHFVVPATFLSIVPPQLPWRLEAVYISGLFELLGALGLLWGRLRPYAGTGLFLLTIAVTPANIYMLQHASSFASVPLWILQWRLVLQVLLLALIAWSSGAWHLVVHRVFNKTEPV